MLVPNAEDERFLEQFGRWKELVHWMNCINQGFGRVKGLPAARTYFHNAFVTSETYRSGATIRSAERRPP